MIEAIEETEEQAAARLRAIRTRKALTVAPAAVSQLRELVGAGGRTERGVEIPEAKTPLLSALTDQADETYAVLLEWVGYFAEEFGEPSPAGDAPIAWRNFQASHRGEGYADAPIAGFKPATTGVEAMELIRALTVWLTAHLDRIGEHPGALSFHVELGETIWASYGLAGMEVRASRESSPRACPECGFPAVVAEFFREPMNAALARGERVQEAVEGVTVRCTMCGWTERPRASKLTAWLSFGIGDPATSGDVAVAREAVGRSHRSVTVWRDKAVEQDLGLPFWTIGQAAMHFGFNRRTVEKYIRDGLPVYEGGLLRPGEVVAHWKLRKVGRPRTRGEQR